MTTINKKKFTTFEGAAMFRARIVCSFLAQKPIRIVNIRHEDQNPGVQAFETSFLRLVERLTNGTSVDINETGTIVRVRPGIVIGGGPHTHTCEGDRGIGWYLEALLILLLFAKKPTKLTLLGITNHPADQSVDAIRTVTLPLLARFGVEDELVLKVEKRGAPPNGGGQVFFKCAVVRALKPVRLLDEGKIKRIRGIVYSTRVSPAIGNRVVESARSVCNCYIPDVYIYTDHYKGAESGLSPGYGVCLVAESTTGVLISSEVVADKSSASNGIMPEDVGLQAAQELMQEIKHGGCVDTTNQCIPLLLMALGPEDVSVMRIGQMSDFTVAYLRLIRTMFGIKFKISRDSETDTLLLSCLGAGFSNFSKSTS